MRCTPRLLLTLLLAAGLALPGLASAQSFSANYDLTRPAATDADLLPSSAGVQLGPVRFASAFSPSAVAGGGLSLETGRNWFGRITVGRSMETDVLALGGGYRWRDGESLSMQLSRGRHHDRLGLAVRYDWPRSYLRFGFDPKPYDGATDMWRFSAGVRF
jgi:hypothetical protein